MKFRAVGTLNNGLFFLLSVTSLFYGNFAKCQEKPIKVTNDNTVNVVAESNLKSKDGWETLKFACVSKFKGKENLASVTDKCAEFLNTVRASSLGIVPFSADQLDSYPKLKKGMSKKELFEKFGRPIEVSDDGKSIYFKNRQFCKSINDYKQNCTVYFFKEGHGISSWDNFKYEFTENLKD